MGSCSFPHAVRYVIDGSSVALRSTVYWRITTCMGYPPWVRRSCAPVGGDADECSSVLAFCDPFVRPLSDALRRPGAGGTRKPAHDTNRRGRFHLLLPAAGVTKEEQASEGVGCSLSGSQSWWHESPAWAADPHIHGASRARWHLRYHEARRAVKAAL